MVPVIPECTPRAEGRDTVMADGPAWAGATTTQDLVTQGDSVVSTPERSRASRLATGTERSVPSASHDPPYREAGEGEARCQDPAHVVTGTGVDEVRGERGT